MLKHSIYSGKKQVYIDDKLIHEAKDSVKAIKLNSFLKE